MARVHADVFDPALRRIKDRALAPVAEGLTAVPPAWLTAGSLLTGLGAAACGWYEAFGAGLVLWIASRVLDGLDGLVARLGGTVSDLGGFLDLVADFVVYAAIPLSLASRPSAPAGLPVATMVLLSTFYVNTAAWMIPSALLEKRGAGARSRGEPTSVSIPEGLVSGGETVLFFALFFLLPERQTTLFGLMALLTGITVLQRVVWAARVFRP